MNKRIKRIMGITLIINVFSIIEPSINTEFMSMKAYARIKGADLEKISLERGEIDFRSSKTDYTLKLGSSVEKLRIGAVPKEESSKVKINGEEVYAIDKYKTIVNLDKGENEVTIKVENGSKKKIYTITIIRGEVENKQIYLNNISLSTGDINFSKEQASYDISVPYNTDEISIRAVPEENNYYVDVAGKVVDEDGNYKKTVSLQKGDNKIDIKIQDNDDHEKIYTLNIKRETESTTNATSTGNKNNMFSNKGWVLNNEQWFYINEQGNKETGWIQVNGSWYYFDSNGVMKTNWLNINGEWYYLNSDGTMKTGWFKNADGKWYYLYNSGIMAKNTTISGYRLDSTGVWIK